MLKKIRIMTILAVLLIGVSFLVACTDDEYDDNNGNGNGYENGVDEENGNGEDENEGDENEDTGDRGTIRILADVVGGRDEIGQEYFVRELEEHLGMNVEMVRPPADFDQVLLTSLAAGEQWDIIQINTPTMDNLVDQGALMQLNDIISGSDILSTHIDPVEWDMVAYDNGHIYGVFSTQQGGPLPVLRQDWLDNLGLEVPTTLDEFEAVLRAFTFDDPTGTGADTFGLTFAGGPMFDLQPFFSYAGLRGRYTIAEDGTRTIEYATEAAIPVLEWLNGLYEEGILDPNFVTNDTATMREMMLTDQVGMVTDWDAWVGLYNNTRLNDDPDTDFVARGIAGVPGPNGIMVRRGDPNIWVIPNNAANVEGAIEFLEFWHTYEGNILGTLGPVGHTWNMENGEYVLTEAGQEAGMDHGVITPNNVNFVHPIGLNPGLEEARQIVLENYWQVEVSGTDWTDAEAIVALHISRAIRGEVSAADAIEEMRSELLAANLIDE